MNRFSILALIAAAAVFSSVVLNGCASMPRSYLDEPTLEFADCPYESIDGEAWPHAYVKLPEINLLYNLPEDTQVGYVELNPQGKQTIIFIHGLGSHLKFWRYQLNHFAQKGYRVLALDMLGYGKSSKPGVFPYTMEAMADVVRAFAAAKNAKKPILIGHSMGGQTALAYAIRFPEEPAALVLTAPAGFEKFSRRERAWFKSVVTVPFIKSADEHRIWGSIRRNNFFRWRPEYEWLVEERVRAIRAKEFDQYAYANVKSIQGLTHTDFTRDNLHRVQVPTLIIHGDMDRLIPNPFMHGAPTREIMEFGHKGIKGSKLTTLKNCGHTVQIDCHGEYNREVSAFFKGLAR